MSYKNVKGALLEYIVRQLLKSCGFTNVKSDGLYSYEASGLYYINGKGAAHDADVIMSPPFQIPFGYPIHLIFECKGYTASKVGLPIVRGALGFRNDVNDFEIVTHDFIKARKNNRRSSLAIELRNRYVYQIGVASVNNFTKPAIEFATNNKIPLLSLDWFLGAHDIEDFNNIDDTLISTFNQDDLKNVYKFFKDRDGELYDPKYSQAKRFLEANNIIGDIVTHANTIINRAYVGLLETGDMVFLFSTGYDIFSDNYQRNFTAQIHWYNDRPTTWTLNIDGMNASYDFYLPKNILTHWLKFGMNKEEAINIKEQYFSKMYIFNKHRGGDIPVTTININKSWLAQIRESLNEDDNENTRYE